MNTIFADYIARIEISSLWSGHKHIVWQLRPDVNVAEWKNGAGKSTIFRAWCSRWAASPLRVNCTSERDWA